MVVYMDNSSLSINMSVDSESNQGATILSPLLLFATGVLGNILAIVTLHRKDTNVITAKFYTLITGLAWTDLLGILITTPSVLLTYVNDRQWVGGDVHCAFHGFTMTFFAMVTPLILCAMAIERFMSIRFVFCYTTKCRKSTARYIIISIWIAVLLFGALPLLGFGKYELEYPGTWCFFDFHSHLIVHNLYAYIFASLNMILIVMMIVCNSFVIITLVSKRVCSYRHGSGWGSPRKHIPAHSRKAKMSLETQMIVLLCSITTVFVLCWAPLMIQIIVTMATGQSNVLFDLLAIRLASLNQVLDPWLYILLRRSFCRRIRTCATRLCKAESTTRTSHNCDNFQDLFDEQQKILEAVKLPVCRAQETNRQSSSCDTKSVNVLPEYVRVRDDKSVPQFVYRVSFINRCSSSSGRSCGLIDVNVSLLPQHMSQVCVRNNNDVTIESPASCLLSSRRPPSSDDRCKNARSQSENAAIGHHSNTVTNKSGIHSTPCRPNSFN